MWYEKSRLYHIIPFTVLVMRTLQLRQNAELTSTGDIRAFLIRTQTSLSGSFSLVMYHAP